MEITIVIPNWNGQDKLLKHLPRVIEAAKNCKIKNIIIVDDASTDESVKLIKEKFPEINLIEKRQNSGFASTVNLGVRQTTADIIVLLNNDASPDKDFLKPVLPHFKNKQVFSVGCNVGGLWTTAKFEKGFFWHGQAQGKISAMAHPTLWVSGGSGVFKRDIWNQLGGLDELYDPFYEEDLDLGYRAVKRGFINLWEPKSIVEHYHEVGVIKKNFSQTKIDSIAQRNQLIFIWKNITSEKLLNEHIQALVKMLIFHPKYLFIVMAALFRLPKIFRKRRTEQTRDKITDEQILAIFHP